MTSKYHHLHFDITQVEVRLVSRYQTNTTMCLKQNCGSVYNCEALMSTQLIIIKRNTVQWSVPSDTLHGAVWEPALLGEEEYEMPPAEQGYQQTSRVEPVWVTRYLQCELWWLMFPQQQPTPKGTGQVGSHPWPSLCLLRSGLQRASLDQELEEPQAALVLSQYNPNYLCKLRNWLYLCMISM